MKQQEAVFLKEEFEKKAQGLILKGKVLDIYYESERILRGWDKKKPRGCSCDYSNMSRIVNSLFEQNKETIDRLYEQAKMDGGSLSGGPSNL
jgi:hypothetical protein